MTWAEGLMTQTISLMEALSMPGKDPETNLAALLWRQIIRLK